MGLFPCSWSLPRKKPVKYLGDHHFPPPRTLRISVPVPEPVREPVNIQIPECERLKPGEEIDTTDVDRMLEEMNNPSAEAKARQIFQMVSMVNDNLEKNIKVIQDAPITDNDNVSRADILTLLKLFSNFTQTLENYIKEQTPSLH